VGWLDRPKYRNHRPGAGAGGHGELVVGAGIIVVMLC